MRRYVGFLTIAPASARSSASWILWRHAGNEETGPVDKAERWRTEIAPLFQSIWPLTAALRSEQTSENLSYMALECGAAFPEAVETILDFLVPYRMYTIAHSLRLERAHSEMVAAHPEAFVKLLNALLDPAVHPIPNDLAPVLEECIQANPNLATHPAYTRLYGLRRMHNAGFQLDAPASAKWRQGQRAFVPRRERKWSGESPSAARRFTSSTAID